MEKYKVMIINTSSENYEGGIIQEILFTNKKEKTSVDTYKQFTKDKTQKNKYKQIIECKLKYHFLLERLAKTENFQGNKETGILIDMLL